MENEPDSLCDVCVDNKATALKFVWIKPIQTGYKTGAVQIKSEWIQDPFLFM